jgi:hypothetical protein
MMMFCIFVDSNIDWFLMFNIFESTWKVNFIDRFEQTFSCRGSVRVRTYIART